MEEGALMAPNERKSFEEFVLVLLGILAAVVFIYGCIVSR
jgi:hypothetical protein